jgi:hypothetical protein
MRELRFTMAFTGPAGPDWIALDIATMELKLRTPVAIAAIISNTS